MRAAARDELINRMVSTMEFACDGGLSQIQGGPWSTECGWNAVWRRRVWFDGDDQTLDVRVNDLGHVFLTPHCETIADESPVLCQGM
jgi:hypothetical protein